MTASSNTDPLSAWVNPAPVSSSRASHGASESNSDTLDDAEPTEEKSRFSNIFQGYMSENSKETTTQTGTDSHSDSLSKSAILSSEQFEPADASGEHDPFLPVSTEASKAVTGSGYSAVAADLGRSSVYPRMSAPGSDSSALISSNLAEPRWYLERLNTLINSDIKSISNVNNLKLSDDRYGTPGVHSAGNERLTVAFGGNTLPPIEAGVLFDFSANGNNGARASLGDVGAVTSRSADAALHQAAFQAAAPPLTGTHSLPSVSVADRLFELTPGSGFAPPDNGQSMRSPGSSSASAGNYAITLPPTPVSGANDLTETSDAQLYPAELSRPGSLPTGAERTFTLPPVITASLSRFAGTPGWDQGLGQRMLWMVDQGLNQAELRLDPPQLGSVSVRITLTDDQAQVMFHAQHPAAREALESALPKLREMFAERGLDLAEADISEQGSNDGSDSQEPSDTLARQEPQSDTERIVQDSQESGPTARRVDPRVSGTGWVDEFV